MTGRCDILIYSSFYYLLGNIIIKFTRCNGLNIIYYTSCSDVKIKDFTDILTNPLAIKKNKKSIVCTY